MLAWITVKFLKLCVPYCLRLMLPAPSTLELPSVDTIQEKTFELLKRHPCLWQCEVTHAILRGDRDIVCILGTGLGKTLTFSMPLLFCPDGIQVVITPLNIIRDQNSKQLSVLGICAIAISAQTAMAENFQVSCLQHVHCTTHLVLRILATVYTVLLWRVQNRPSE